MYSGLVTDSALFLGLNVLDLVIIALTAGIGFWGWRLGILRTAVVLLAVGIGVFLAGLYHERVFIDLAISESPSGPMRAASFFAMLALVCVGGYIAGALLRGVASLLLLGWADRVAGGLFGAIFGLLLIQAGFAIVVLAGLDDADGVVGHSVIGWAMLENVPVVRALLPAEFDTAIQGFVAEVEEWREAVEPAAEQLGGG
ncbi:MAG: CvpA family protein [Chloroflexi bacterium]|nr:CvpA family protein [Chloroflexota bacterium]MYF80863.1 CvpA family protein [Chloroflexota bacterium]MYI04389.1 CvpA family protein [Chloroflexota bacterium]